MPTSKRKIDLEWEAGYDLPGYMEKYGDPEDLGEIDYDSAKPRRHLTDEFKLPHHITFSTDSKYHSPETPGGKWENIPENGKDKWHYTPSQFVIDQHGEDKLQEYFSTKEPDSVLHLPKKSKVQRYSDLMNAGPGE